MAELCTKVFIAIIMVDQVPVFNPKGIAIIFAEFMVS